MNDKVDLTSFPEGFNLVKENLDFLPQDDEIRNGYMHGLLTILMVFA